MLAPKMWKKKVLLAKIETTYGTDAVPTGAANSILATNVRLSPMEGQDVSRDLELPYMGAQGTIPTELHRKLAFNVEATPSGTAGTAPAWGVLMRGCACAEVIAAGVSVTYNPVTDDHEAVTLYLNIDGTLFKLIGSRGTCTFRLNAQGIVYLEFEFIGLYSQATETPMVTPDLAAQIAARPKVASTINTPAFSIGGVDLVMTTFMLNIGNQVETTFEVGHDAIEITGKSETIETSVRAVPLTTLDPFALADAMTPQEVILTHGTTAGRILGLNAPGAQFQRTQSLENAKNITRWPLRLVPLPVAGNDQWTMTLT
ncbi:MAG: phage tail tube protein [Pseudodonghicola sp.]